MKSFFDACFRYELDHRRGHKTSSGFSNAPSYVNSIKKEKGKENKKALKTRVVKLYETAIGFYSSAGNEKIVNKYQRDLDNFMYAH